MAKFNIMRAIARLLKKAEQEAPVGDVVLPRPRMTPNQQLYSRPHGPRARAILERQDAKIKAGRNALWQLNDDTRRAFEARGMRDAVDADEFAEGMVDDLGMDAFDHLSDAERVGPMADMQALLRQQRAMERAQRRLRDKDFNVPRNRYNGIALPIGLGGSLAALLRDER